LKTSLLALVELDVLVAVETAKSSSTELIPPNNPT